MKSTTDTLPSVWKIFWRDATMQLALKLAGFCLVGAFGMHVISQPGPYDALPAEPHAASPVGATIALPMDDTIPKRVIAVALLGAAISAFFLVRRYLQVRTTLRDGSIIKATVEDIAVHTHTTSSNSKTSSKPTKSYSYYATLRYALNGVDRTVELKLPSSGSTFGIHKGHEVELSVLESRPDKPLIRSVYL